MNAIDHMDYHPSQTEYQSIPEKEISIKQKKRSVILQETGQYIPSTCTLSPADERFLKLFLQALTRVDLELHKQLIQIKHFDAMTWVLGWGVYSNSRAIKQINNNLRILEGQNVLQEFKICLLAKYLNVTYTMVNRHEKMLYEIDSRIYVFERTLQDIMNSISTMKYEIDLLDHIQIRLNRIHSSLFALQSNTDTIYECL